MRNAQTLVTGILLLTLVALTSGCRQGWARRFNPYAAYGSSTIPAPGTGKYRLPSGLSGQTDSYYQGGGNAAPTTQNQWQDLTGNGYSMVENTMAEAMTASYETAAANPSEFATANASPIGTGVANQQSATAADSTPASVLENDGSERMPVNDASNMRAPDQFTADPSAQPISNSGTVNSPVSVNSPSGQSGPGQVVSGQMVAPINNTGIPSNTFANLPPGTPLGSPWGPSPTQANSSGATVPVGYSTPTQASIPGGSPFRSQQFSSSPTTIGPRQAVSASTLNTGVTPSNFSPTGFPVGTQGATAANNSLPTQASTSSGGFGWTSR